MCNEQSDGMYRHGSREWSDGPVKAVRVRPQPKVSSLSAAMACLMHWARAPHSCNRVLRAEPPTSEGLTPAGGSLTVFHRTGAIRPPPDELVTVTACSPAGHTYHLWHKDGTASATAPPQPPPLAAAPAPRPPAPAACAPSRAWGTRRPATPGRTATCGRRRAGGGWGPGCGACLVRPPRWKAGYSVGQSERPTALPASGQPAAGAAGGPCRHASDRQQAGPEQAQH
jgi:hypothetical protein